MYKFEFTNGVYTIGIKFEPNYIDCVIFHGNKYVTDFEYNCYDDATHYSDLSKYIYKHKRELKSCLTDKGMDKAKFWNLVRATANAVRRNGKWR